MSAPSEEELFKLFSEHFRDTGLSHPEEALEGFEAGRSVPEGFLEQWYAWQVRGAEGSSLAKGRSKRDESELYRRLREHIMTKTEKMRLESPSKLLAFGSVQSGKTRAYTRLIREIVEGVQDFTPGQKKVAVIVLTGVHEKLRSQTHRRLEADLSDLGAKVSFPCGDADVGRNLAAKMHAAVKEDPTALVLTVKKVASRLDNLEKLFNDPNLKSILGDRLILIIDDECDQVSTDMARSPKRNATRIGSLIWHKRLRSETAGVCYIGFSATPFANLMLSNERGNSLFPSDGILNLPTGDGYMGPEHYFRKEGHFDVVTMPDAETARWKKSRSTKGEFTIDPDGTLADSVLWFGYAAAQKRMGPDTSTPHTTAMIHAHTRVADHRRMHAAVKKFVGELCAMTDSELELRLQKMLARTTGDRFSAVPELTPATVRNIREVLRSAEIIQDHSKSSERLEYHRGERKEVIVIGGHTLSRGLTLEGLVSSYFVRSGDFAYDTFLQFCRWYGYRTGYENLTRVWMTDTDAHDFAKIAECEQDLREQIAKTSDGWHRALTDRDRQDEVTLLIDHTVGRLPAKTLDAAQTFGAQISAGSPVPTRFFDPNVPRWTDAQVCDLLPEARTADGGAVRFRAHAKEVIDFLKKEGRSEHRLHDRIQLALDEGAEWDVLLASVQNGDSSRTFTCYGTVLRRARHRGQASGNLAYVKDFTSKDWRSAEADRPLLIISPVDVGPDGGSWSDIAVAVVLPRDVTIQRMRNSSLTTSFDDIEDLETDEESQ